MPGGRAGAQPDWAEADLMVGSAGVQYHQARLESERARDLQRVGELSMLPAHDLQEPAGGAECRRLS
jgi:hypothetical protein